MGGEAVLIVTILAGSLLAGTKGELAKMDYLGAPCRAKNVLAGRVVADRQTQREWLVLTNMNEKSHMELIFIDFHQNTGTVYRAPAGAGSWALEEVPGDRLIVGTYYDAQFMVFDLKKMAFVKTVGFPGESYIWNLAMGRDGRIYGGTYGGGKLGAFDLRTYTVEDCGAPAPPNMYLRFVSATPDGRILCSFGMEKPTTLLYDPTTKKFSSVPPQLAGVSMAVTWNGYLLAGNRAFRGEALEEVKPLPFPTPPAEKGGWSVDVYMSTPDTLYLRQGHAIYRYKKGDPALTLIADIDLRGGRPLAGTREGWLVGVRGQDYFVLKPGDKTLQLRPIPVESEPRPTHFLRADDRGRVWGGPTFGQTLFWLDAQTKKAVNTGTVCDSGGEVYDVTFHKGCVYAAAYAGGDIVKYNPDEPWDQWNNKNPKTIASVNMHGYIRPTGGIVTGPDGKLYSGWMAKYGTYGGAVAITDPESGQTELIENPFGQQAVVGLAVDERFAYIGTSLGANGLPNKTEESPRFGVLDLKTRKVVFMQEFAGYAHVGGIVYDAKTQRVTVVVGGKLMLFDTQKLTFVKFPQEELPGVNGDAIASCGDGRVCYASGKTVIEFDMTTGEAIPKGEAPRTISHIAIGGDGTIYAACGADIYRLPRR